jgi:hypothetical protein
MSQNRAELNLNPTTTLPCGREAFEDMLELMDELHTAASDDELTDVTDMKRKELVSLLREVMYLAQETIDELQKTRVQKMPVLHLVEQQQSQVKHKAG